MARQHRKAHRGEVSRALRRRVPLAGGGFTTVPDGREVAEVEIWVDWSLVLENIGLRALCNRKGKSTAMSGAIVAHVCTERRRIEPTEGGL